MTQREHALQDMKEWLMDPHEIGMEPEEIGIAQEFDLHDLHYYVMKYKVESGGEWLVGVCGGYENDELENCGHTFSEMEVYKEDTAVHDCIEMVENVRAYYMQRANDWEEENQDDGSNAKYGAFVLLKNTTWDKVKYKKLLKSEWDIESDEEQSDEVSKENRDTNLIFNVGKMMAVVSLFDFPVPDGEAEYHAAYNYRWKQAVEETKKHKAHLLISVLGEGTSREKGELWVKLVSTATLLPQTIGIYTLNNVYEPSFYYKASMMMKDGILPIMNLVNFGLQQDKTGINAYTEGLSNFGKKELEVIDTQATPNDLIGFLMDVAGYVIEQNVTFHDGETLGASAQEKLKITLSEGVNVEGMSFKIEY